MIHHHLANKSDSLLAILQSEIGLESSTAQELLSLGAIYVNHKRANTDLQIKQADYIRTHANPRRFPAAKIIWAERIIANESEFVVVNKPRGIPTHPTVDNIRENVTAKISEHLNCEIFVTHRLDVATSGLLVLAKTKNFQRLFNWSLQDGLVKKDYFALVKNPPPVSGLVRHFMEPGTFLPKKVSKTPVENWQECLLEIKEVIPAGENFLVKIGLLTGRTHQIRAQLSDLGCAVIGDQLYDGTLERDKWYSSEQIALSACFLNFALKNNPEKIYSYQTEYEPYG